MTEKLFTGTLNDNKNKNKTFLISIYMYFPLRLFNGGNNHFQGSRNKVMITESVGGMNVNKLTRKGSDNQVQSVSFSCREVH